MLCKYVSDSTKYNITEPGDIIIIILVFMIVIMTIMFIYTITIIIYVCNLLFYLWFFFFGRKLKSQSDIIDFLHNYNIVII